jgi:hypothetical protein
MAIAKWSKEYFANQYCGKLSANTPEFDQFLDLLRVDTSRLSSGFLQRAPPSASLTVCERALRTANLPHFRGTKNPSGS